MNTLSTHEADSWSHNGSFTATIRVLRLRDGDQRLAAERGPGWHSIWQGAGKDAAESADCWLLEGQAGGIAALPMLARSGLPVVVRFDERVGAGFSDATLIDLADAFVFVEDDAETIAAAFSGVLRSGSHYGVRDISDGTARTINALSAEASRIANALALLADAHREAPVPAHAVSAALIRRQLRLRRERDRFFPAEIFGDPAWDMLLDLMAAQLEGRQVPVSSLCIAAGVPTTTALRWIRSLTEAGLFVRRLDPDDARRAHISLSGDAATAMLAWLRLFSDHFTLR